MQRTGRRFGTKAIRSVATAIVTAGVVSAALATPASAAPFDFPMLSAGSTHFGANCVPVGSPLNGGLLDWAQAVAPPFNPRLTGDLCIQNSPGRQARMVIESYKLVGGVHTLLATRFGGVKIGTGNALDRHSINLGNVGGGPELNHLHVLLEDDSVTTGTLAEVDMVAISP